MLSRRALLVSLLPASAAVMLACDDPNLVHIPASTGRLATLSLPRGAVMQGGTFIVALSGEDLASATVAFAGRRVETVAADGMRLAIVGTGQVVGSTEQVEAGVLPVRVTYAHEPDRTPRVLAGEVTVTPAEYPVVALTFTPQVTALLDPALIAQETAALRAAYSAVTPERRWEGYFLRPSAAAITDVYGSRRSYNGGPPVGSHSGVDFGAVTGDPAAACAAGRVALARALPVRGNTVILDHGAGVFSGYCHLSALGVAPGQVVRAGEVIGAVGDTGLVTGAHLHWEVVAGGMHVDGMRWLAA